MKIERFTVTTVVINKPEQQNHITYLTRTIIAIRCYRAWCWRRLMHSHVAIQWNLFIGTVRAVGACVLFACSNALIGRFSARHIVRWWFIRCICVVAAIFFAVIGTHSLDYCIVESNETTRIDQNKIVMQSTLTCVHSKMSDEPPVWI